MARSRTFGFTQAQILLKRKWRAVLKYCYSHLSRIIVDTWLIQPRSLELAPRPLHSCTRTRVSTSSRLGLFANVPTCGVILAAQWAHEYALEGALIKIKP